MKLALNINWSKRTFFEKLCIIILLFILSMMALGLAEAIADPSSFQQSSESGSTPAPSPSRSMELSALMQIGSDGLHITNQETDDWSNCMVGINGDDGWNFQNPPYKTYANISSIPAGQEVTVPYSDITDSNGTRFDALTQNVNATTVICYNTASGGFRMYFGTSEQ